MFHFMRLQAQILVDEHNDTICLNARSMWPNAVLDGGVTRPEVPRRSRTVNPKFRVSSHFG